MSTPRVRTVQTLVRLIYEDGTVGAVTTMPIALNIDMFEPASLKGSHISGGVASHVNGVWAPQV